jgi:hypothetical protein
LGRGQIRDEALQKEEETMNIELIIAGLALVTAGVSWAETRYRMKDLSAKVKAEVKADATLAAALVLADALVAAAKIKAEAKVKEI